MVPSHEIFWGVKCKYFTNLVIFFRKFMKIIQNSKKRRENISEYYQNGFDDGLGTKKEDYNKISR